MSRKKTLDRITYLVSILVALPVFGLIGCGIFGLACWIKAERMKAARERLNAARETAKPEQDFVQTSWCSFYGAINLKSWVADPAVEDLARKFLQLDYKAGEKVHDKVMFPFAVKFVAADGDARILFFNTGHCSFDRKKQYPHHLSGEEIEKFYCTVGARKRTDPEKKGTDR